MKKLNAIIILVLAILLIGNVFGQSRQPQFEVFGGIAIPLAPDEFKDYYKIGFSPHVQYVLFPSERMGISFGAAYEYFSFDGDKLLDDLGYSGSDISVEGSASNIELSVGIRPYLTPADASTQMFLFGMGTFNFLKTESEIEYMGYKDKMDADESKMGLGAGAGLEMPLNDNMNLIIQGVFRFIFTEEDMTSFIGITAGITL